MGISGILSNSLVNPVESIRNPKHHWRWVFLGSFAMTVNVYINFLSYSHAFDDDRSTDSDVPIPSLLGHIIGGFLVGMGTKIGNGCTTGASKNVLSKKFYIIFGRMNIDMTHTMIFNRCSTKKDMAFVDSADLVLAVWLLSLHLLELLY